MPRNSYFRANSALWEPECVCVKPQRCQLGEESGDVQVQDLSCLPWADKGQILLLMALDLQQVDGARVWLLLWELFCFTYF